jgi:phospholipase/lecithinase/hemolysin
VDRILLHDPIGVLPTTPDRFDLIARTAMPRLNNALAAIALGLSCAATGAQAGPYSSAALFGDSLSDTGNVLSLSLAFGATPFPNYVDAPGRFSNGPVWVEGLAAGLGVPALAAPANQIFNGASVVPIGAPGGTNYAFGGARTALGGSAGATTGLIGQLINWNGAAFSSALTRAADPGALYIIAAGGNDLRDARSANPGTTAADAAARQSAAATAAQNIVNIAALLAQAGARHFLVANVPDLGRTPEAVASGVVFASTDVTLRFNAALDVALSSFDAFFLGLTGIDLDIRSLDLAGVADAVNADPAAYGITNLTTPCINPVAPGFYFVPGSNDADGNCPVSAFADDLHPSARIHQLFAREALATAAVPTPATWTLVAVALLALGLRGRFELTRRPAGRRVPAAS